MKVVIAGCGIGGLATALALHDVGIDAEIYEQAREVRELGVGINLLPHAVKELAALGLLPELDKAGIRTRRLIYMNRFGHPVWDELRGMDAGYVFPQISIHRGKLQTVLYQAVIARLGARNIHTGHRFVDFDEGRDGIVARFERRSDGSVIEVTGDVLIGADGIHSRLRSIFYPDEGPPVWNGIMLWRGATDWPVYADGRTMVIAGGNAAKFVYYPIYVDPARSAYRLTNWAIMARLGDGSTPPPRREDWSRPADMDEVVPFARDKFRLGFVDLLGLIEATEDVYEYPCCDRDAVPRWSFGRATLLGDAAHPMYPTGSNGASQAILDARCLARLLSSGMGVTDALKAYEDERLPATSDLVLANRRGGPEGVIDLIEERAPNGFDDIDAVASYAEREAIVRGYASMAGYAKSQVNRGSSGEMVREKLQAARAGR